MPTTLRALGTLEICQDGRLANLTPLDCVLLTYLAVERRVDRETVCFTLWGRVDRDARRCFSQALYHLQQGIGTNTIEATDTTISLNGGLWADVHVLQTAVQAREYAKAVEVYGGPFLPAEPLRRCPEFSFWVDRTRSYLRELFRRAVKAVTEQHVDDGKGDRAVEAAWAWTSADWLDDEAHHVLIDLLDRAGHRSRALGHYRRFRKHLRETLDVEPLEKTTRLVEEIRRGRVA